MPTPLDTALSPAFSWFESQSWQPFDFQRQVWQAYLEGESGLIHAATGTGKTYAAWLGPLLEWIHAHPNGGPEPTGLQALWITPLRALAADTAEQLNAPIRAMGLPWTLETRTSDTSSTVRSRQRKRLPNALITTPESLALLLARPDSAALFSNLRAVIVDEWHELMSSKRGVQTELNLARLRTYRPGLRIWGLSATMGNLDTALQALIGVNNAGLIVQGEVPKALHVQSVIPPTIERFPWAGHLGLKLLPEVIEVIERGRSALVFTNTRSQTETWYQAIIDARPDWIGDVALHHGSLDKDTREWVEKGLREGRLRCVVCTSSLDLGVDFSPVDQVLQIGSPKGVARLLQRSGRSGHQPNAESVVTCVPTHAFELIEVAAARDAIRNRQIEDRPPIERPLDVLVQHIVTVALGGGFRAEQLFEEVKTTYAYRHLSESEWAWTLDFATRGGDALRAYPEYARVAEQDGVYTVQNNHVARLHRMSIGTISSDASLRVQYIRGAAVGDIDESFAARLKPGDKFVLGGKIVEFVRLREMKVWVRSAKNNRGIVPRWFGGQFPLTSQLSQGVRVKLDEARRGLFDSPEMQAVRPILALQERLSAIPALDELLIERVKTREGYHLFFFPFEGRLVHEGLAALFAYRLSRLQPITFTLAFNDYGFELLSPEPAPLDDNLDHLFDTETLIDDILHSLNAAELAKRQFREIARIAGLVFSRFPGGQKSARQLQASSGLLYDVFAKYDPDNLLLQQARREVLERQLEQVRMVQTLRRLRASSKTILDVRRPTPLAFPLLVDRLRQTVSSETLADRVRKMQLSLETAADRPVKQR